MATTRPTRPVRPALQSQAATPLHSQRMVVIGATLLAMVVAAGGVWAALGVMPDLGKSLPVREVVFVSATKAPLSEIDGDSLKRVADALQTRGARMLQLDLIALKNGVKQIAWVRDANVRRQFPSTIVVAIEEHRPVATWGFAAPPVPVTEDAEINLQSLLVNSYGEVFRAVISDERKATLPMLDGPDGSATEVLEKYAAMIAPLAAIDRAPKKLLMSARRAWQVTLDDGGRLQLGRNDSELRLLRYVRAYPQVVALQKAGTDVDLRFQSGFAIATELSHRSGDVVKANGESSRKPKTG